MLFSQHKKESEGDFSCGFNPDLSLKCCTFICTMVVFIKTHFQNDFLVSKKNKFPFLYTDLGHVYRKPDRKNILINVIGNF